MAQPANTFSSYDARTNREDLDNIISNISPSETPVLTAIKRGKATGTNHEYTTDALAAPSATNAHIEGNDAVVEVAGATVRLGNYTQILKKHIIVSGTQESVNKAGQRSEVGRLMANKLAELKTDIEMSMIGANQAKVAGNDTTARQMGSLQAYITDNTSVGATGADSAGNGAARTDGTQRVFTEALLTSALSLAYTSGANPSMLVVSAFNKAKVSGFTGNSTPYHEIGDKKIVATVDVYIGDFHTLKVMPSRHVRTRDALLIDPAYLKLSTLRPTGVKDLARTGDSLKKEVLTECTLEVCNPKAHGGVFDLTTA